MNSQLDSCIVLAGRSVSGGIQSASSALRSGRLDCQVEQPAMLTVHGRQHCSIICFGRGYALQNYSSVS